MKVHEKFMKKCLHLAQLGVKKTKTNPLVGCVIVHKGAIISEGYHEKFGGPHAEVNAINNVIKKEVLAESTLYVNLEPCAHYGKTPPCVDLIIKHKIRNIVIGTRDPFKQVNGHSINKLRKHSNVIVGVLLKECINLNKTYFINHSLQRPFIILKWAESKDGFINNSQPGITQISCLESIKLSHRWRSEIDGIMVGTNTILCDNPQLTNRYSNGKQPVRITIDRNNQLKNNGWNIMDKSANTIIFHNNKSKISDNITYIDITGISQKQNSKILLEIVQKLYKEGIKSMIIEGGKTILETCIKDNLWDEMRIFCCNTIINEGIKAPTVKYKKTKNKKVGSDFLTILYNKKIEKRIEQSF